ncbi:MAG: NUDIX domain-containing protein [Opitutaceae bacterium]|nr:NUDIX domain-containing protein [Paracoccaceae bacterium]MCP5528865.1 NUDIX domain-containing protein [Opitutaceae bacterium]
MKRVSCAAVIVRNPQGKVLLLLRDNRADIPCPNQWTLPGGIVETGETPLEAACREVEEETGLQVTPVSISQWDSVMNKDKIVVEQHLFYAATTADERDLILGEGQKLEFFSAVEWRDLNIAFGFKAVLEQHAVGSS